MAVIHAAFPEGVFTDCDTIRLGILRGPSWVNSSKRRYRRVWSANQEMPKNMGLLYIGSLLTRLS